MAASKINIRNLNAIQTMKVSEGKGTFHGHLVAEAFDDVSNAVGSLVDRLAAAEATIKALQATQKGK